MRVLWLSHFIPFPPRGGNVQRSFNLLRQASRFSEVSLVALNLQGEPPELVAEHKKALENYCADVDIWDLPYPWKGMRWWTEALRSPLYGPTFSSKALFSPALLDRWKRKLAGYSEVLVHVDSIDLALYCAAIGGFPKVLNHHNCESALALRRAAQETNPLKRAFLRLEARKLARLESSLCRSFGVNTVVCEGDRQRLLAADPAAHFHVVENGVDTDYFQPASGQEEPHTAIFTGTLDWQPNLSAARYLVKEIWPKVKKECPDARLYLAGKNPPEMLFRLAKAEAGVEIFPNPDDMRPLLARASVFVCSLLEGGGTRLKILDAMAMARPVVSTAIGCEGLRVTRGQNILVADSCEEFATAVLRLFRDEQDRKRVGRLGRATVESEYAWSRISRQIEGAYQCAKNAARLPRAAMEHCPVSA